MAAAAAATAELAPTGLAPTTYAPRFISQEREDSSETLTEVTLLGDGSIEHKMTDGPVHTLFTLSSSLLPICTLSSPLLPILLSSSLLPILPGCTHRPLFTLAAYSAHSLPIAQSFLRTTLVSTFATLLALCCRLSCSLRPMRAASGKLAEETFR